MRAPRLDLDPFEEQVRASSRFEITPG